MADTVEYVHDNPKTSREEADWPIGWVGLILLGTLVFLVIVPFVLMAAFPRSLPDASRRVLVEPPAPRLQVNPAADLARFRAEEDRRLNTYYWVDRQHGIVHIPIREAMKKLVRDGIPGFPKAAP
jgi:hypothetical protein